MSGLIYIENPELVSGVSGSGSINRLPVWTGLSTLGNSALTQLGTLVGVNVAVPTAGLSLPAGTTAAAALNFATGVAPTTPNVGDVWFDGTDLKAHNGAGTQTIAYVGGPGVGTVTAVTATAPLASTGGTTPDISLGTVGTAKGGTGLTGTPTNGQLLIGNGTGYTLTTLTAGTGVTIVNGTGTITISAPDTGTVTGTGTTNYIPLWTGTTPATALTDSPLSFSGSTLTSSAALTTLDTSATANFVWRVQANGFALKIGGPSGNATLSLDTNNRYVGINVPTGPATLLHVGDGTYAGLSLNGVRVTNGNNSYFSASDGTRTIAMGVDGGNATIGTVTSHDLVLRTGGYGIVARVNDGSGFFGFNLAFAAAERIHVNGALLSVGPNVAAGSYDGAIVDYTSGSMRLTPSRTGANPGIIQLYYTSAAGTITLGATLEAAGAFVTTGPVRATGTSATTPAFTGSDTDTGMYFPASNQVRFSTGGTLALAIDSSQNVGIGTASPNDRLEVNGNARFTRPGVASQYLQYYGDASYNALVSVSTSKTFALFADINSAGILLQTQAAQPIAFSTNNSERVRIDSVGKVGIGTNSPTYDVDVIKTTVGGVVSRIRNSSADVAAEAALMLNAFGNSWAMSMGSAAKNSNALTWVLDYGGANTEMMRLTTGGYVGIGTTSPYAVGTAWKGLNVGISVLQGAGSATASTLLAHNMYYSTAWQRANTGVTAGILLDATPNIIFYSDASGAVGSFTPTERMRINSVGNVGIGTASPGALLDVNTGSAPGSYVTSTRLSQTGTAANSGQRILFYNSQQAWEQGAIGSLREGANNDFSLTFFTSALGVNAERVRITSAGNVGIGTTGPANYGAGYTTVAISGTVAPVIDWLVGSTRALTIYASSGQANIGTITAVPLILQVGGVQRARIDTSGNLLPELDNTQTLGSPSRRWSAIYAGALVTDATITDPSTTGTTYTYTLTSGQSGIFTATKDVLTATATQFFTVDAGNGAHCFDATFVVSAGGFSVAKKFTVVAQFGNTSATITSFKLVDTGPYSGADLTVTFARDGLGTGTKVVCTVQHAFGSTVNVALTLNVAATSAGAPNNVVTIF